MSTYEYRRERTMSKAQEAYDNMAPEEDYEEDEVTDLTDEDVEYQRTLFIEEAGKLGFDTKLWIESNPKCGFDSPVTQESWLGWIMCARSHRMVNHDILGL